MIIWSYSPVLEAALHESARLFIPFLVDVLKQKPAVPPPPTSLPPPGGTPTDPQQAAALSLGQLIDNGKARFNDTYSGLIMVTQAYFRAH